MKIILNGGFYNIKGNKVIKELKDQYYVFEDSYINDKDILIDKNMVKYYIVDYKNIGKLDVIKLDKRVKVGDILYVHHDYYEYDLRETRRQKLKRLSEIHL